MSLPQNNPRVAPRPPDDAFDSDFGLGGPGEGVAFDDHDDEHRDAPVTVTHGVTYLPLLSLSAYHTIACVQAGAAEGRRVVLWSADEQSPADRWQTPAACLLIEVVNLRDAVTLGSVADQLRALLGPAHMQGIRDPRRALDRRVPEANGSSLAEP